MARRLTRLDNRRMAYLRSLFGAFCDDDTEAETRCLLTFSLRTARPFIAADNGPYSWEQIHEMFVDRLPC